MGYIFVSYSSKDAVFVEQLATDLKNYGYQVWLDKWQLNGQNPVFFNEIKKAIDSCSHFLFIITPSSLDASCWALRELFYATGLRPPPVPVLVVAPPVSVDYKDFPLVIPSNMYQVHDFSRNVYSDTISRLVEALKPSLSSLEIARQTRAAQIFDQTNFDELAGLLTNAGYVTDVSARSAFCSRLGLDAFVLPFSLDGGGMNFSATLVSHLYRVGDFDALERLCVILEDTLKGPQKIAVETLRRRIEESH